MSFLKMDQITTSNKIAIIVSMIIAFFSYTKTADSDELNIQNDIKSTIQTNKPYIIKKNDTLWDIAEHFFKTPKKWVSLWENNPYILNPHLIYPGNKVWFSSRGMIIQKKNSTKHKTIKMFPRVIRTDGYHSDDGVKINKERKVDFISSSLLDKRMYILSGIDDRLFFAKGDVIYIKSNNLLYKGETFSVVRKNKQIRSLKDKTKKLGVIITKFATVTVISDEIKRPKNNVYKAIVDNSSEEISSGYILLPYNKEDGKIRLIDKDSGVSGKVVYISNDATEAAETQLIIIEMTNIHNVEHGQVLYIYNKDKYIIDPFTNKNIIIDGERIGKIVVLKSNRDTLTCVIIKSSEPILKGYVVESR